MSGTVNRIADRMIYRIRLALGGHILNPLWHDRLTRRKRRDAVTLKSTMAYLDRYTPEICAATPAPVNNPASEPERCFSIWFQGEEQAPPLVRACFRSMRRHLEQEVIVLDEKTLFEWITLPDHIVRKWREGKIPHAHFSDICRVELLYQHGGIWLDATGYVTSPVPQWIMDEDLMIFLAGQNARWAYSLIQNCFIRARKGNPLLGIWREAIFAYWRDEDSKIDYFVHHLLFRASIAHNKTAAALFDRMPHVDQAPTHTLWRNYREQPYDPELFRSLTEGAFFQKTNYKDKGVASLPAGSMGEFMIKQ